MEIGDYFSQTLQIRHYVLLAQAVFSGLNMVDFASINKSIIVILFRIVASSDITRKLSIFAFVAVATTVVTLGASTTFATSNIHTHHHHIQLMSSGNNSINTAGDSWAGSFSPIQYGSSHAPPS